jgi:predicted nucleic acid-binding protein
LSQVVINDASILIDLHRLGLLKELASLPYQLWIPDSIWEDELLSISEEEKQELSQGFRLGELSGVQVLEAQRLLSATPRLSLNDCFALVLAKSKSGCILLCSDRLMRSTAESMEIKCHGLFWTFDRLFEFEICSASRIFTSLKSLLTDPRTRMPKALLQDYTTRYSKLAKGT